MASELKAEPESSSVQDMPHGGNESHTDPQTHSSPDGKQCQDCASAGDMAATLKDIREFMRSAMKSLDIPVPEDDEVKIDLSLLKPKDSMYNEEAILDFWRKRLPTAELLEVLRDQVLLEFTGGEGAPHWYYDPGISPVMVVSDGNSKIGPIVWNIAGYRKVHNGRKVVDLIKKKWPSSLGVPENEIEAKYRPPFKNLFVWNLSPNPEGNPSIQITSIFRQKSYDEDGYPTYMPLDDYKNDRLAFEYTVRITRILRFSTS
jgi:hypothetical protein